MVAASDRVSCRLRVIEGDDPGREMPLEGARVTIGRRPSNDLVVSEIQVSGVHAEIVIEGGRAVLRDLGSTNGTYLDGNRIDEVVLDHGETIGIGRTRLLFVDPAREASGDAAGGEGGSGEVAAGADLDDAVPESPRGAAGLRRRRAPAVLLGLLVVVVAAAIYFYLRPPTATRRASVPARPENVTGDLWSFEDAAAVADRVALSVGGLEAWRVLTGEGRSGTHALGVDLSAGQGALALVRGLGVRPEHRYRIRVQVRGGGSTAATASAAGAAGTVALGAGWSRPEEARETVPLARSGAARADGTADFAELEGVVDLPAGASTIDVLIGALGPGQFAVDDLEVIDEGPVRPPEPTALDDRHGYRADGTTVRLIRGGREVLVIGRPVLELMTRDRETTGSADVSLLERVDLTANKENGRLALDVAVSGPIAASRSWLGVDWLPPAGEDRIRSLSARGIEEYAASFESRAVGSLLLGSDKNLVELRFTEPVTVKSQQDEGVTRILIGPADGLEGSDAVPVSGGDEAAPSGNPAVAARMSWRLGFELRVDFREQAIEASRLVFDARRHLEHGEDGDAYLLVERLLNRLPYDEDEVAEARRIAQEIMTEGHQTQRDLEDLMAVAAFLDSPTKLREVALRAEEAIARFGKTPLADSLRSLAERAHVAVDEHRAARVDAEAERLFGLYDALKRQGGREGTAELIRRYIETRFSNTRWASRIAAGETGGA